MTDTKQPEALRLAQWLRGFFISEDVHATKAQEIAGVLERLHAENTTLQQGYDAARLEIEARNKQLVKEAARTAEEKLRADRMTEQHRMQAAMHAQATERPRQCLHGISEPSGWMPIETAPKDGTLIVLGARNGVWLGKYLPLYGSGYRPENPWSSMLLNHDHMAERYTRPTHWMPLPPSPSSADEGGSNG